MAQRIVTTCDLCDDGVTAGEPLDVAIGGTAVVVDVCEAHRKPYADLLAEAVEHGRTPNPTTRARAVADGVTVSCPTCVWTGGKSAYVSHRKRKHPEQGSPCPACGKVLSSARGLKVHRDNQGH